MEGGKDTTRVEGGNASSSPSARAVRVVCAPDGGLLLSIISPDDMFYSLSHAWPAKAHSSCDASVRSEGTHRATQAALARPNKVATPAGLQALVAQLHKLSPPKHVSFLVCCAALARFQPA